MCGGGDKASKRAEQRETERQAQIKQATSEIDRIFNQRGGQQQDFVSALRDFFTTDVRKQQQETARQAKFGLARSGLTGGSAAVDIGTTLGDEFTKGLLTAEQQSQGALADLRGQDESTRQSLLALAQTGLAPGTAAARASESISANIAGARSRALTEGVGSVFGGTADIIRQQQEGAERRKGLREANVFADPFSR